MTTYTMRRGALLRLLLAGAAAGALGSIAVPAAAQTTVGSIRGQVSDAAGAPAGGAAVVAINAGTNQTQRVTADANGNYVLNGLRPGTYEITITGANGETFARRVIVSVAQSATLDATLGTNAATGAAPAEMNSDAASSDIVVNGSRLPHQA